MKDGETQAGQFDLECALLPHDECDLPPWDMGETPVTACPACQYRWHMRAAADALAKVGRHDA